MQAGGAESLVRGLAHALQRRGHSVTVIMLDACITEIDRRARAELRASGIHVITLNRRPGSAGLAAGLRLLWTIATGRYDIVHSHLPMCDAFVSITHHVTRHAFRHVVTVHNTREGRGQIAAQLCGSGNLVYCSRTARSSRDKRLPDGPVICNGINLGAFSEPDEALSTRQRLGVPGNALLVVGVGSIKPQKNYELAIRSLACVKNLGTTPVYYAICGDGPTRSNLERLASDSGLRDRVLFLGSRSDVPQLLSVADLFLSTAAYEGLPIAVLEAFAAGLPCMLSPIPEHREISIGMPGVYFPQCHSENSFAAAIQAVLESPAVHRTLAEARRESLRAYSIDQCAATYEQFYRTLLGPNRNELTSNHLH